MTRQAIKNPKGKSVEKFLDRQVCGHVIVSSGEFVGMVADDTLEKIKLKMFHPEIINDHEKQNAEVSNYSDIPAVSNVSQQQVLDNYYLVKMDIKRLIGEEVGRLKKEKTESEN